MTLTDVLAGTPAKTVKRDPMERPPPDGMADCDSEPDETLAEPLLESDIEGDNIMETETPRAPQSQFLCSSII